MRMKRFMWKVLLTGALLAGLPCAAATAQESSAQPSPVQAGGAETLSDAMRKSEIALSEMKKTGDIDQDFAIILIARRQSMIDLARIEFKYGKNSKLRDLAGEIIKVENREINRLVEWQRKNPAK